MSQVYSLVEYFGRQKVNSCGYCKTSKGHYDYGMWFHFLRVMDYQNLIDRGWRRSGLYGYKPVMKDACCALYTIRCAALNLKLKKSQKKLIKRFNRFIIFDERRKWHSRVEDETRGDEETMSKPIEATQSIEWSEKIEIVEHEASCSISNIDEKMPEIRMPQNITKDCSALHRPKNPNKKKNIRIEKAKKRIMAKGKSEDEAIEILKSKKKASKCKTLGEFLQECEKPSVKHKLEVKLVQSSPSNEEFEKTFELEYGVYKKYQTVIHKDDPAKCTVKQFRRFLVTSPLQPKSLEAANAPVESFGSYHQQYWLDGKLIAVGVIDILPFCVSSVYFFYDPDYNDLVLGSYSSMRELQLVRELHKYVPSVQYYYMGYYIHTCPKMTYKARISPSYLLCPETYTFHPIDQCLPKITANGVCRLHPDPEAKDEYETDAIDQILILVEHTAMTYSMYRQRCETNDQTQMKEFGKVIGEKCVESLLLLRP